ncbi:1,4-alpha-glucan branching protein domain-containing protein [Treponema vincentii]|uniref:1,4-alpha-glucan branching protein domain-containing protein n=1 Tax=Treponema vincentii TaxID=69710 RepID=UPI003D92D9D9
MVKKTLLFIFHAHVPYIPHADGDEPLEAAQFYELLSYGFLPFLRMCERLDADTVPFKCTLVISPLLCEMLNSSFCRERYGAYLDRQIAFARQELKRAAGVPREALIRHALEFFTLNREDFNVRYKKDILSRINSFAAKDCIELLATSATPCFFPFYQDMPEALTAQIEQGLSSFRENFATTPFGFWLPLMGYDAGVDRIIKSYGIDYTVLETQSFLFADRPPVNGIFSAAMGESGFSFFGKDSTACADIAHPETGFYLHPDYLDTDKDVGFELDGEALSTLFDVKKGRRTTGLCYSRRSGSLYDEHAGAMQAERDAERFVANRNAVLTEAAELLDADPLCSVSVLPLRFLGKTWMEGIYWLESVFRKLAQLHDMHCALPSEYLKKVRRIQSISPFYASNLPSGYADELINSSNDWMFPRIQKATERMIDLAGRFPDDQGLKERTLNMAAKELLLAQSTDWPLMTDAQTSAEYAAAQCEEHLNAFTDVYDSLGSGTVGTDRLIKREKEYPIFSEMDYRFFIRESR